MTMPEPVMGDEVLVHMPGFCIHERYGVWTGETKPAIVRNHYVLPEVYEIEFFEGEIDTLWLAGKDLTWL